MPTSMQSDDISLSELWDSLSFPSTTQMYCDRKRASGDSLSPFPLSLNPIIEPLFRSFSQESFTTNIWNTTSELVEETKQEELASTKSMFDNLVIVEISQVHEDPAQTQQELPRESHEAHEAHEAHKSQPQEPIASQELQESPTELAPINTSTPINPINPINPMCTDDFLPEADLLPDVNTLPEMMLPLQYRLTPQEAPEQQYHLMINGKLLSEVPPPASPSTHSRSSPPFATAPLSLALDPPPHSPSIAPLTTRKWDELGGKMGVGFDGYDGLAEPGLCTPTRYNDDITPWTIREAHTPKVLSPKPLFSESPFNGTGDLGKFGHNRLDPEDDPLLLEAQHPCANHAHTTHHTTNSLGMHTAYSLSQPPTLYPVGTTPSSISSIATSSTSEPPNPPVPSGHVPPPYKQPPELAARPQDQVPINARTKQPIGAYTRAERMRRIVKFKDKKRRSILLGATTFYMCRRRFAKKRPRYQGRFLKMDTSEKELLKKDIFKTPKTTTKKTTKTTTKKSKHALFPPEDKASKKTRKRPGKENSKSRANITKKTKS